MEFKHFGRPALAMLIVLLLPSGLARASDEDWAAARKASCQEIIDAYRTTVDAEKRVADAMKDSRDGTVAANVLGVATLAAFGFGFFTWNDDHSAQENLDDLRHDLVIIRTVAAEKKCQLPTS